MNTTRNRLAIIKCLTEPNSDCGGFPPYSASSIHYMLEHHFAWYGYIRQPSLNQIRRTLRDLSKAGLITKESRIDKPLIDGLPKRVNYWQMADAVDRNKLLHKVRAVCSLARKVHGTFLFGNDVFFDKPKNTEEKAVIILELKALT